MAVYVRISKLIAGDGCLSGFSVLSSAVLSCLLELCFVICFHSPTAATATDYIFSLLMVPLFLIVYSKEWYICYEIIFTRFLMGINVGCAENVCHNNYGLVSVSAYLLNDAVQQAPIRFRSMSMHMCTCAQEEASMASLKTLERGQGALESRAPSPIRERIEGRAGIY